ncbi:hypothetical protein BBJ28_00011169 [Nothophytophthora sp. Chile5]|nr:hypothetical protein BBJ28_00011169 [Nothophytophthora sp. Chile5]
MLYRSFRPLNRAFHTEIQANPFAFAARRSPLAAREVMGRYTTVQTFSDQDAKGAAVAYDATSSSAPPSSAAASVPAGADGAGAKAQGGKDDASKFHLNRVDNVSGSSAGAGSGDFHMYRAARRRYESLRRNLPLGTRYLQVIAASNSDMSSWNREMERVAQMEQRYAETKAQREFEEKRKRSLEEFEAKVQKRAEKRRRRKERAKANALSQEPDEGEEQAASKEETEKETKVVAREKQVPETPGGVPEIPNDGSFLERMLAMQKQQQAKAPSQKEEDA